MPADQISMFTGARIMPKQSENKTLKVYKSFFNVCYCPPFYASHTGVFRYELPWNRILLHRRHRTVGRFVHVGKQQETVECAFIVAFSSAILFLRHLLT